jgi:hypothetical protein
MRETTACTESGAAVEPAGPTTAHAASCGSDTHERPEPAERTGPTERAGPAERTPGRAADDASEPGDGTESGDPFRSGDPFEPDGLAGVARELLDRVAQDNSLTRRAQRLPGGHLCRRLARCRATNAAALREIVEEHGWPTAALVGSEASTAALMILLHADDLPLQLTGRDLIADAVERGQCPPIHAAYAVDHCAVELGRPQRYGTRYTPLGRPFPVADPDGVDARRVSIGLRTMAAEQQALAEIRLRHLNRASA